MTSTNLVKQGFLDTDARQYLYTFEAAVRNVNLAGFIYDNASLVKSAMKTHGAILFRGFAMLDIASFHQVANALIPHLKSYENQSSPRRGIHDKVYTSTEYPAAFSIPMHNECSYTRDWPQKIMFYCAQPSATGGETPIASSAGVYAAMPASLRNKFIHKQVAYVRNYAENLGLSWRQVFQVDTPADVAVVCDKLNIAYSWHGDRLKTTEIRPAVYQDPRSQAFVWFNQAHLFNVNGLDPIISKQLLAQFNPEDLPRHSYFGDGEEISAAEIQMVNAAYQGLTFSFLWQPGDMLFLDNIRYAHGRNPFQGERSILVAMGDDSEI